MVTVVRDFQAIVGFETKEQFKELTGKAPDYLMACVGGAPQPTAASFIGLSTDLSAALV